MSSINMDKLKTGLYVSGAVLLLVLVSIFLIGGSEVFAKSALLPDQQVSPVHPTFSMLDEYGENVLDSGRAVSTMKTCGACHDTEFIAGHSFHADVGLEDFS
ncbi:MAG: hypothetical protein ACWGN2_12450, partial [Anaerolineales bacterium]